MHKIDKASISGLENCADEEIHLIGTIQEFSKILGFDRLTQKIVFCSEYVLEDALINENDPFTHSWEDLSELCNNQFFTAQDWSTLIKQKQITDKVIEFDQCDYVMSGYVTDRFVIVEYEEVDQEEQISFTQNTAHFVRDSNNSDSFRSYAGSFSQFIKNHTGYDRVMVYRFDESNNGQVFAESKEPHLPSYLDLHYPHTDIPPQARELYKKKWLRMLTDVNAKDQRLLTQGEALQASHIDLGPCNGRSSSPIHLEYLRNMGVSATLTISIMIDEQLWGLVACHHYSPIKLDYFKRRQALLFTQLFANQVRRWEASEEYAMVKEKEHIYQVLIEELNKGDNKFQSATKTSYFTGLTESDGGAVIRGEEVYTYGEVPDESTIQKIQNWMISRNERVFLTSEFSKHVDFANSIKKIASGVLYYSFDERSNSAMIWFRKQLNQGVRWGGDMDTKSAESTLSPRKSFDAWEEKVDGKSAAWRSYQIQAGLRLGAYLEKEVFIRDLKNQKRQLEHLTDQLQSKNEELSQFNWISSHDMKEPLRKIRLFIDQIHIEEERLSEMQKEYFGRLDKAAERMQDLITDLLDYAKLSKEEAFRKDNVNLIIEELKYHFKNDEIQLNWEVDHLPDIEMIRFQIKQLFSNLISNAIKFRKADQAVNIRIKNREVTEEEMKDYHLAPGPSYVKIVFEDNGIGFEEGFNDRVFEVFQRLHSQKDFEGTGIGLAICKKIVSAHNGEIIAAGRKGKGAQFTILLPTKQPKTNSSL